MYHFEVKRIVWIDLEMTGLDYDNDKILEIAVVVTDSHLNLVAEGPDIIIHQPDSVLNSMDPWCLENHGKTGLTMASKCSAVTVAQAEQMIIDFLTQHTAENLSPLAGNTVYVDRVFLMKHMPRLDRFLHYRIIDVSSVKELCRRWNRPLFRILPKKGFAHRALADIYESVDELKFYREHFFKVDSYQPTVQ